jgi:hypothetical protein
MTAKCSAHRSRGCWFFYPLPAVVFHGPRGGILGGDRSCVLSLHWIVWWVNIELRWKA